MPRKTFPFLLLLSTSLGIHACKNREVNPEDLSIREIHVDIPDKFDIVERDGLEYLILERDRNNPHEGFGFMALKGNKIIDKLDSIQAYQKVLLQGQARIISRLEGISYEDALYQLETSLSQELR